MNSGPWQVDFTDEQDEYLQAWLRAHPAPPLADWERRVHEAAFDVEPPEVDEDTQRGDMADARAAEEYGA